MDADPTLIAELVLANHILFRQGVVDGFGHVSARHDRDPGRFLLSRSMAPALVAPADIMEFDLDSEPVDAGGRTPYLERFIHGEIYRARSDVMAVVHDHSPAVIPFGVSTMTLRPVSHMGGFLGAGAPVFEIRDAAGPASDMLIRDRRLGAALARSLGGAAVALMRGHGAVAVGSSIRQAVFRAVYTEANARIAAEALRLGPVTYLTPEEAANVAAVNDRQIGRAWDLWALDAAAHDRR
jgi:ribulose-5-phosphate 4-epimerase/fuculose-1-phosphate aldolase